MPSVVRIEGKVSVCLAEPNKHTSQLDGANLVVMEQRWVVLMDDKLKIYDKKVNLNRKKIFDVEFTDEIKGIDNVYIENPDTRELFNTTDQFCKWTAICREIFLPATASQSQSVIETNTSTNHNGEVSAPVPNSNHSDTIQPNETSSPTLDHTTSNSNQRPHTFHGRITSTKQPPTSWPAQPPSTTTQAPPPEVQPTQLDLSKTDDVAVLKQEILNLRRKVAIYREERESLGSILTIEKDFVRDRQNKLDSWEHFARLIVFKAVCNHSKNEKLKTTLNKILAHHLPTTKSVKISRMEVIAVNLPNTFEESPNFGLTNYDESTGIATFNFQWYPQNCTCTLQIDGHKYIGGAIPISFKVAIDLLSKLKIKGDLLLSKGEGNQFLISLPRLPELTFASPTKLQIGDIHTPKPRKAVESAVFNALKKSLVQPAWKEVHF